MFKIKQALYLQNLKICTKCQTLKTLDNYSITGKHHTSTCKPCKAAYSREKWVKKGRIYMSLTLEKKKECNEKRKQGWKQYQLAAFLGVGQPAFSKWKKKGLVDSDNCFII
jgi:hypothetical protein